MFQYSDMLVAAAGFVGGHVAYPELELGAAYDKAMQTRVFGPLGMTATTLDHRLALRRPNRATAHTPDRNGKQALAMMELNDVIIAQRPAGGAWSNVRDMLKYVQVELASGTLPDGKRYVAAERSSRGARRRCRWTSTRRTGSVWWWSAVTGCTSCITVATSSVTTAEWCGSRSMGWEV